MAETSGIFSALREPSKKIKYKGNMVAVEELLFSIVTDNDLLACAWEALVGMEGMFQENFERCVGSKTETFSTYIIPEKRDFYVGSIFMQCGCRDMEFMRKTEEYRQNAVALLTKDTLRHVFDHTSVLVPKESVRMGRIKEYMMMHTRLVDGLIDRLGLKDSKMFFDGCSTFYTMVKDRVVVLTIHEPCDNEVGGRTWFNLNIIIGGEVVQQIGAFQMCMDTYMIDAKENGGVLSKLLATMCREEVADIIEGYFEAKEDLMDEYAVDMLLFSHHIGNMVINGEDRMDFHIKNATGSKVITMYRKNAAKLGFSIDFDGKIIDHPVLTYIDHKEDWFFDSIKGFINKGGIDFKDRSMTKIAFTKALYYISYIFRNNSVERVTVTNQTETHLLFEAGFLDRCMRIMERCGITGHISELYRHRKALKTETISQTDTTKYTLKAERNKAACARNPVANHLFIKHKGLPISISLVNDKKVVDGYILSPLPYTHKNDRLTGFRYVEDHSCRDSYLRSLSEVQLYLDVGFRICSLQDSVDYSILDMVGMNYQDVRDFRG